MEILRCKTHVNLKGWKSKDGYWWLRSIGLVYGNGYDVGFELGVCPALHLKSDTSSLPRDEENDILYGKLPDGTDASWVDVSKYLGEPTLLMTGVSV